MEFGDIVKGEGKVIANFALHHFHAGALLCNLVVDIECAHAADPFGTFFDDIRAYCSACIGSAAAALEALINELFIAHDGGLRELVPDFEESFWGKNGIEKFSILEKYDHALMLLKRESLNKTENTYLDAQSLIYFRNSLVHFKPNWDQERPRAIEVKEALQGRFAISPFLDEGADFISMKCMSAGCAKWAVETVRNFVLDYGMRSGLEPKTKFLAFKGTPTSPLP